MKEIQKEYFWKVIADGISKGSVWIKKNTDDATIIAKIFKVIKNETPSAEAFTKEFLTILN